MGDKQTEGASSKSLQVLSHEEVVIILVEGDFLVPEHRAVEPLESRELDHLVGHLREETGAETLSSVEVEQRAFLSGVKRVLLGLSEAIHHIRVEARGSLLLLIAKFLGIFVHVERWLFAHVGGHPSVA